MTLASGMDAVVISFLVVFNRLFRPDI